MHKFAAHSAYSQHCITSERNATAPLPRVQQLPHYGSMSIATNFRPEQFRFTMGDRMRKAIEFSGLSSNKVAEQLQVNRSTVSNWLNGRNRPRRRDLVAFALMTGYPAEWLETGEVPQNGGDDDESRLGESNSRPIHYE